jgi:microcystin degradation protein MlrC
MTPRLVFLAGLFHETNTFLPGRMAVAEWQVARGAAMLACKGDGSPLGAAIEEGGRFGWEILPAIDVRAVPGASGEAAVLDIFFDGIEAASASLARPPDAIFLVLHGAMVVDGLPDVEGHVLARMRRHPLLAGAPIFGVLDLHANYTSAMAGHSNALLGYQENPHTDAAETAVRAARLLQASLDGDFILRTRFVGTGIVWPPPGTGTTSPPMKDLEAVARGREIDGIHQINVFAGFAHADTPDTGLSFSIIYDPQKVSESRLDDVAEALTRTAETGRQLGIPDDWNLDAAIDDALAKGAFPVCLVEPADNIGGGAPGDGTTILRALLVRGITNSGVILNDPESVAALGDVKPGDFCRVRVGGKALPGDPGPVSLDARLLRRSDGAFLLEDRHSHMASMCGVNIEMGPCAVIESKGITILLTSRRTAPMDLGQWRSQGVEPSSLRLIGVKAAVAHRRAYDPITKGSYWVRTPGPCSSDLRSLPYRLIRRPVFPLDPF